MLVSTMLICTLPVNTALAADAADSRDDITASSDDNPVPARIAAAKRAVVGVGTLLPTRRPPAVIRGTGFVVGDGRYVLSNYHVIPTSLAEEQHETLVVFVGVGEQGQPRTARVIQSAPEYDLALLRLEGPALPAMTIDAQTPVREGDDLLFTGFPLGHILGLYPTTTRAMVSNIAPVAIPASAASDLNAVTIRRLKDPYPIYQLDAIAYPGNSGSPLYRVSDGAVVGVINSVLVKESKESALDHPTAITYAIPIKHALPLLEKITP
ncbi:trypsin-like peptidase domain-containing protein [Permianibacter sp. IMCC34836]|nr:trypsin-like peptidase domain-containing protein [Permianibacter fluminis]